MLQTQHQTRVRSESQLSLKMMLMAVLSARRSVQLRALQPRKVGRQLPRARNKVWTNPLQMAVEDHREGAQEIDLVVRTPRRCKIHSVTTLSSTLWDD